MWTGKVIVVICMLVPAVSDSIAAHGKERMRASGTAHTHTHLQSQGCVPLTLRLRGGFKAKWGEKHISGLTTKRTGPSATQKKHEKDLEFIQLLQHKQWAAKEEEMHHLIASGTHAATSGRKRDLKISPNATAQVGSDEEKGRTGGGEAGGSDTRSGCVSDGMHAGEGDKRGVKRGERSFGPWFEPTEPARDKRARSEQATEQEKETRGKDNTGAIEGEEDNGEWARELEDEVEKEGGWEDEEMGTVKIDTVPQRGEGGGGRGWGWGRESKVDLQKVAQLAMDGDAESQVALAESFSNLYGAADGHTSGMSAYPKAIACYR